MDKFKKSLIPLFTFIVFLNLIAISNGEQVFSDLFDNSTVEDASSFPTGDPDDFWLPAVSSGSTGSVTESGDKLIIQASGNIYKPYSCLYGNIINELDFFDHPVTVKLDGIKFEAENGSDPATQCLYFKLNSTSGLTGNDAIEVIIYANGSLKVDIIKNGVATRNTGSMDYPPEALTVYLDDTNFEVSFYHSKKIIRTIKGAHGITSTDWNSTGCYPVFRGVRLSSEDKWVKFSFGELKCFDGAIWREIVPELGKYSMSYQYMDWSDQNMLGENTAFAIANNDPAWQSVNGESARVTANGLDDFRLSNVFLKVDWTAAEPHYYNTTMYNITNCKRVTIENVGIIQEDFVVGRDTIRIIDCEEVYIKDLYIHGSVTNNHIWIEGAKYILIDRVHISGAEYPGISGKNCGHGIVIQNLTDGLYDLEFLVIQNSYIHDYDSNTAWVNHDGIATNSNADGIIFNNCLRNWQGSCADAALDISHRREDVDYRDDYVFRIERNFIDNCNRVKNPGISHSTNKIIWCNNLFYDVWPAVYHYQYAVYRVHDTYIYDNLYDQACKLWNVNTDFSYIFNNCLFYACGEQKLTRFIYDTQAGDKKTSVTSDYNLFYLEEDPTYWYQHSLDSSLSVNTFSAWQALGKDINSLKTNTGTLFTNAANGDYTMASGTVAEGVANLEYLNHSNPGLRVERDFYGYYRSTISPCAGAFDLGSRTPYPGLPLTIPGKIEAENFDNGSEGSAYHDETAGNAGYEYRTDEDVDIYPEDNSFIVKSELSSPLEYLKYTVNVESSGSYRIDARAAGIANINRTFTVYIDNVLAATYTFQNGNYHTSTIAASVTLSAGIKEIEIRFNNSNVKLNYIEFIKL